VSYLSREDVNLTDELERTEEQGKGALEGELLNHIPLFLVDAEEAYQEGVLGLEKSPWFFLKQPPAFIEGKIPLDGATGKAVDNARGALF